MQLSRIEIKNYRGIKSLDLDLAKETVLVGENNTGKTSILHALRNCLERIKNRKGHTFEEYDFHFESELKDPSTAPPISIILYFVESNMDAWPAEFVRAAADVISLRDDDKREIKLRITSGFDQTTKEFVQSWAFLDFSGNTMTGKAANPNALSLIQHLFPIFYLSALRDAGREFSKHASFWSPFIRSENMSAETKTEIEQALSSLNEQVVNAHESFEHVVRHLSKMSSLLRVGGAKAITIEAVSGKVFDLLSKAQVNIRSSTGAKLPIGRHGEGTQSIAVLLLFDAFLKSRLLEADYKNTYPILALEEPEAHLHPCAIRTLWKTLDTLEGQKIISTHSGDLISEVPLHSIRRLYRKDNEVKVGSIPEDLFDAEEKRKFDFHVRRSRGELIFSNCWVIAEGETEDVILRESAKILNIDLDRWGIRIITYQNGAGLETYLKAAKNLGIKWVTFLDGDTNQGAADKQKAQKYLDGQKETDLIFQHEFHTIEEYLCDQGFGTIYIPFISEQKKSSITLKATDPGYWKQVISALGKYSKPGAALDVMTRIETTGQSAVPELIAKCLQSAFKISGDNHD
ncbi:MAG: DUF2813 domain-containing protein [Deltaproteobacteria bacterium]|nr:DUF2813 domain-containing protein [Deltaproteobacteria bacterium]